MKRREIEEELRKEAEERIPDVYERVMKVVEEDKDKIVPFPDKKEERKRNGLSAKKKIGLRIGAVAAAAVLCLGIALPVAFHASGNRPSVGDSPNGGVADNPSGNGTGVAAELSVEDIYGISAVTTVSLMNSAFPESAVASLSAVYDTQQEDEAQLQAESFHEYFLMLKDFFGEGMLRTVAVKNTDEAFAQHEIKLTVTGKDLYGNEISHLMYYTETEKSQRKEKHETKSEYSISGVMVTADGVYELRGERKTETETEDGETETEEEFRMRAYPDISDESTYVEMKQEFSVESDETEQKYVYSVIKDGSIAESTVLRFESETKDDKTEVKYRLEFISGKTKGSYQLKKETKNDVTQMKVEYDIENDKGEFTITETGEGNYIYIFRNGDVRLFAAR